MSKEMATYFRELISVNVRKASRKSQAPSREMLRLSRLGKNDGLLIRKTCTHYISIGKEIIKLQ